MEFFCTLALFSSQTPVIDFAPPWPKDKSNLIIPATLHNSQWSIDRNCSLFLRFRFFYLRRVVEKYFHTSSAHIFLAGLPSADCRRTAQQQKKAEENFSPPKTSLTHTSAPTAHTSTKSFHYYVRVAATGSAWKAKTWSARTEWSEWVSCITSRLRNVTTF